MTAGKTKKKPGKRAAGKAAARETAAKPGAKKRAKAGAKKRAKTGTKRAEPAESTGTAADVNLGHVFALRPRVEASFGPEHLRRAKDQLAGQTWASLPEAARAVAEKALEIAREAPPRRRG